MSKEKISYDTAVKEIESILALIEGGDLGVDELAEKVSRVTLLLKTCRDRLYKSEEQIDKILGDS
ncbi:MAG: exodeoxyribonuclease VII small subunit [Bacteroidales bacterium]|nr:exodeoxyribonuclease VII small subunit [Bacteroidales bacterium]